MLSLYLLPRQYIAHLILKRLTVRIHTGLIQSAGSWVKLWYLLRGFDLKGSGYCRISLCDVCQILGVSSSTVRQWLREGQAGAGFRWWRCRNQCLRVALGSLHKVCLRLRLYDWGVVASLPIHELHKYRAAATGITTQRLQQLSRFAAWRSLSSANRKLYKLPYPEKFFDGHGYRLSDDAAARELRCVMHIGSSKIFVSKGFIPYGTTQRSIAAERGYKSDRTVRRHHTQLGTDKRQIVQSKAAYGLIKNALRWDSPGIAPEPDISMTKVGMLTLLTEPSGRVGKIHSTPVEAERFFTYGDRHYIYRPSIYRPTFRLCSMRRSIRNYRALLNVTNNSAAGGVVLGDYKGFGSGR